MAITFTEAAAAELRDRIRQELERAVGLRDGPDRERCWVAARQVDLASIQTIHSFAGRPAADFPLEANLPPGFSTLDEIQQERGVWGGVSRMALRRGTRRRSLLIAGGRCSGCWH